MPENAYRMAHLRQHANGTYAVAIDSERDRIARQHPDWPRCHYCQWPVDPVAGTVHMGCPPETARSQP